MKSEQTSLFPTRDTLQAVLEEANAQLPIATRNELIALLQTHTNTILQLIEQEKQNEIHK